MIPRVRYRGPSRWDTYHGSAESRATGPQALDGAGHRVVTSRLFNSAEWARSLAFATPRRSRRPLPAGSRPTGATRARRRCRRARAGPRASPARRCGRVEHDERVHAAHGRQPMRDHDRRPARHQRPERVLNERLALGVERARGLVEDQDRRVLQDRARDRDALALSAGELDAALADERVVAVRQRLDELGRVRELGGASHLRVGGARAGRSGCCRRSCGGTSRDPAARTRSASRSDDLRTRRSIGWPPIEDLRRARRPRTAAAAG